MSTESETFKIILFCGFCGQLRERDWPVKVDRGFKIMGGCDRCMIKGRKGERVRFAPTRAKIGAEICPPGVHVVKRSRQWQHGTHIELEGHLRDFDLMDFTPETFQPTDFQQVKESLIAKGASFVGIVGLCSGAIWTGWHLNEVGIILATDGNSIGLYDFVGVPGAPVESDLAYLESRVEGRR